MKGIFDEFESSPGLFFCLSIAWLDFVDLNSWFFGLGF